ncbi:MAG: TetR/AcrR family transcriptional regulator [Pelagimonas sp.]
MTKPRLSQEDWIAAGFRALAKGGPAALRAEAIARDLKTTKGSFYWHFKDLPAFKSAMLQFWAERATTTIIDRLAPLSPGLPRLEALIDVASETPEEFGGTAVEPAIRDWARYDAEAAQLLQQADDARTAYLAQELAHIGVRDAEAARLFYAAHLGLEQLSATQADTGRKARYLLLNLMQSLRP